MSCAMKPDQETILEYYTFGIVKCHSFFHLANENIPFKIHLTAEAQKCSFSCRFPNELNEEHFLDYCLFVLFAVYVCGWIQKLLTSRWDNRTNIYLSLMFGCRFYKRFVTITLSFVFFRFVFFKLVIWPLDSTQFICLLCFVSLWKGTQ